VVDPVGWQGQEVEEEQLESLRTYSRTDKGILRSLISLWTSYALAPPVTYWLDRRHPETGGTEINLCMILIFSLIILIVVFMNFRVRANKINYYFIYQIFIEIKTISYYLVKIKRGILLFLFFNYNSYIYYGVGITINYGYVFIYALALVILL